MALYLGDAVQPVMQPLRRGKHSAVHQVLVFAKFLHSSPRFKPSFQLLSPSYHSLQGTLRPDQLAGRPFTTP